MTKQYLVNPRAGGGCFVLYNGVFLNFFGWDTVWQSGEKSIVLTKSQNGKIVERNNFDFANKECRQGIKANISWEGEFIEISEGVPSIDFFLPGATKPGPLTEIREGIPPENKNLKGVKR